MKICSKCKAQLADDAEFCTGCGQKLETVESSAGAICQKCGNSLSADAQFCTKCGAPVGETPKVAPPIQPQTTPPVPVQPAMNRTSIETGTNQGKTKKPMMLIIGIVAVLLIGGFLIFGKDKDSEQSGIPKTPEEFVTAYNKHIKRTTDDFGANASYLSIGQIQTGNSGIKGADFADGNVTFKSERSNGKWNYMFIMSGDMDEDEHLSIIAAAIRASGANSGEVMKGLGIQEGKSYSIPFLYQNAYTASTGQGYIVQSIGISIFFTLSVEPVAENKQQAKPQSATPNQPQSNGNISRESVQQVPETQGNALQLAQKELEEYGVSCPVVATSYGHNSNGFLAVCSHTTRPLVLVDRINRQVATFKAQNKTLERFVQSKNESGSHSIIIDFWIQNAVRDSDASLGTWSGNIHKFPIYCLYKFDSSGEVIPGRLTSGRGEKPSHYQEFLQEQRSVDLANLFLTEMMTLWADAQKRNVTIK